MISAKMYVENVDEIDPRIAVLLQLKKAA